MSTVLKEFRLNVIGKNPKMYNLGKEANNSYGSYFDIIHT